MSRVTTGAQRSEVLLVNMPYATVTRPSIALGLLKAALLEKGIASEVLYANLLFAEIVGLDAYLVIDDTHTDQLVGEWTFSRAAFEDGAPDEGDYFTELKLRQLEHPPQQAVAMIRRMRDAAPPFIDNLAERVLHRRPRIVGCSSCYQQHCASLALLRSLKSADPTIVTVLGGSDCDGEMAAANLLAFPWLDYVVSGEAESVFPELCADILADSRAPRELPGVLSRRVDSGRVPARATVPSLEDSPLPDYVDYFDQLAASPIHGRVSPGLPVEGSRGCWWGALHHCTFCGLNDESLSYRAKSSEKLLREIHALCDRFDVRKVVTMDNILAVDHLKRLLPSLAADKGGFSFFWETKANLKREHVRLLSEAGIGWIQPGIESLHDEILSLLDKGTNAATNVQLLKWAREYGIHTSWNFLVSVPGQRDEWYREMVRWLPLLWHLQPPQGVSPICFDRFSPYFERAAHFGLSLQPASAYRSVYPLPLGVLRELAYFYELERDDWGLPSSPLGYVTQAQRELEQLVADWRARFRSPNPPRLLVDDDGRSLHFFDSRPRAKTSHYSVAGLAREVFLACDSARGVESLTRELGSRESVVAALTELSRCGVVVELGGRFVSLALRASPRLPPKAEFPGGYVQESNPGSHRDRGVVRTDTVFDEFLLS